MVNKNGFDLKKMSCEEGLRGVFLDNFLMLYSRISVIDKLIQDILNNLKKKSMKDCRSLDAVFNL
jgi:hypothetical protein